MKTTPSLKPSFLCDIKAEIKPLNRLQRIAFQSYYVFIQLALCALSAPSFSVSEMQHWRRPADILFVAPRSDRESSKETCVEFSQLDLLSLVIWLIMVFFKKSAHSDWMYCKSDADITCSSATCSLLSCSLWQRRLFQIWGNRLNPWPPCLPHLGLVEVLWLSSRPWYTGRRVHTPEAGTGRRSPPGSCQSNLYEKSHLQEEINRCFL